MTRDPRSNPAPGDRLSLGGTVRHVLSRSGDLVSWEVEGLGAGGRNGASSLRTWQAQMRSMGGVALESGTGQRTTPQPQAPDAKLLSPRALRVLGALQRHTPASGGPVVARCRAQLHEAAVCSRATWDRATDELVAAKLLVIEAGPESWSPPTLRLTERGGAHPVPEHPLSTPPEQGGEHPSTETSPLSSKSLKNQKKESREQSREGGAHPSNLSTPLSTPHGVRLTIEAADEATALGLLRAMLAAPATTDHAAAGAGRETPASLPRGTGRLGATPRAPAAALKPDEPDANGWTHSDLPTDEACPDGHGPLVPRVNGEARTRFLGCSERSCKRTWDPAVQGRRRGKNADLEAERRAAAARARPRGTDAHESVGDLARRVVPSRSEAGRKEPA